MRQAEAGIYPPLLQMPDENPQVPKTKPTQKLTPPDFSGGGLRD
jgi:hypothetical protein